MDSKQPPNHLQSLCDSCNRKGFTWARGTCQYCGYHQFPDSAFSDERESRGALFTETEDECRRQRDKLREKSRRNSGGFGGDGGGDWGGCDDGGDC